MWKHDSGVRWFSSPPFITYYNFSFFKIHFNIIHSIYLFVWLSFDMEEWDLGKFLRQKYILLNYFENFWFILWLVFQKD